MKETLHLNNLVKVDGKAPALTNSLFPLKRQLIKEELGSKVTIHSKAFFNKLCLVAATLVLLSLAGTCIKYFTGHDSAYGFIPSFNLDTEGNISTYFSAVIMLIAAGLLRLVALQKKKSRDPFASNWIILSALFFYLSLDEAAGVHEFMINPLRDTFHFTGVLYFSWVIVGLAFVVAFAAYYLRFYFALPKRYMLLFGLAGATYITGTLGIEMLGGYYADLHGIHNFNYELITTVEESLELTGILLLIRGLLSYLHHKQEDSVLTFQ